jgi:hypothetical protein
MKFYGFDESGYFLGEVVGQRNPAFGEQDQPEYLQPAKSTELSPPNAGQNKIQRFVDGAWSVVDHPQFIAEQKRQEEEALALAEAERVRLEREQEAQIRAVRVNSAKAKLGALGLTEEEILAIIGG